jgi:hypothetical protein
MTFLKMNRNSHAWIPQPEILTQLMLQKEAICSPKFIRNMTNITTKENLLRNNF